MRADALLLALCCVGLGAAEMPSGLAERLRPSVFVVEALVQDGDRLQGRLGTGFAVAPGLIATNHHVVAGLVSARVRSLAGGASGRVRRLSGEDERHDLALLAVTGLAGPPLPLIEPTRLATGLEIGRASCRERV